MALRTRKPTGDVPPPVILLEGETGSGRSWTAAELSASPKVGRTFWIELGDESTADQYGAIPDVRYEIVRPDNADEVWDWHSFYGAVRDARDEAARAATAGEPPAVLIIDQVGAIWEMLAEWADNRAQNTKANKKELADNPNYEYVIGSNFWNDATDRWKKFMTVMLTFKGIVVLLSRGEEITLFENGQPTKKKTWKVAGQKGLTSAMPIWVRLTRDGNPKLIKLRAVKNGIRDGVDREQGLPGFTLERLIFERYGWDPATSGSRTLVPMVAGSDAPLSQHGQVIELAIETAETVDQLRNAYNKIKPTLLNGGITEAEAAKLSAYVGTRKAEFAPTTPTVQPAEATEAAPTNGREPVGATA